MPNYTIEGGMNFYEELYKMLDEESPNNESYQDLCLITNQPLTENYVTLECNHKFNYMPLFNDIRNHKKKFNSLESHKLSSTEIRCPYCRNKQKKLLPYYESMGTSMKVVGVNAMPEPPPGYQTGICCFDDSNYCSSNVMMLDLNNKTYCSSHYSYASYQFKKAAIKKEKEEAKQKAKEEMKKTKEETKQKEKEAKQKEKEEKQKAKEEAKPKKKVKLEPVLSLETVLSLEPDTISVVENENTIISSSTCSQMVKSGPNKGNQCKCKVYMSLLCKRHYTALTPTTIGPLEIKYPSTLDH
jgi:DNA polymerase III alpha subunit (gram-positive type)